MNLDNIRRQRAMALANGETHPRAKAKQEASGTAKVFLDDVIDSWGWPFGISAKEFRQTLDGITADTIELHINSPGGDAFEGVAIYNALRQHDAKVTVVVDGLAASAASLVAMAGDEVVMGLGTQLMVHDAWALAIGNAEDMQDAADRLSKLSDGYAEIYAGHTGRPVAEMREVMRAGAWLNADEAITQGFADRKDDYDGEAANAKAKALADGVHVRASDNGYSITLRGGDVYNPVRSETNDLTVSGNTTLSGGLTWAGAWDVVAAHKPPSAEPVDRTTTNPTLEVTVADDAANAQVAPGSDTESPPTTTAPAASAAGPDLLAEVTKTSQALADANAKIAALEAREAERDKAEFFGQVVAQGRLAPADRAEYEALYDAAPEQTRSLLLARAVGSVVPVAAIGHEGDGTEVTDDPYTAIYGKGA